MIKVDLKGTLKEFELGVSVKDVAKSVGEGLFRAATSAKLDGTIVDLRQRLDRDCSLQILTFDDKEGRYAYWHTTAHILAQAVSRLYRGVKFGIGPSIDSGFYYDIDFVDPITRSDLEKIENEMRKIIKEDLEITKEELTKDEALKLFKDAGQDYKIELIEEHAQKGEKITIYKQGEFFDLCAGPHLLRTRAVKEVSLTDLTGAYWRADSNNKMLTRIYGISFPKKSELKSYLNMLEEAKKRDHRKLGKQLNIFTMSEYGAGFPIFLPNGVEIKNRLIDYWRKIHKEAGYVEISTPIILSRALWERSGHWEHYKENIYTTKVDDNDYAIKPMNCPGGILAYKTELHSYRDFPLRMGELGIVHRHELSGALHGLMRARCFTQDDAHIYITPSQIKDEIKNVVALIDKVYQKFGFEYNIELSTMPENHMGDITTWEKSTSALKDAMEELGRSYEVNEGDGAFYGPKLDFHLKDCLGRSWQCGTIQLDFLLPQRFDMEYTDADGGKKRPIMIHRVVYGSIERFIGILTEHYCGAFPLWLAPVQVKVLPISQNYFDYAEKIGEVLKNEGFSVLCDLDNEKIGYKIRRAQLERVPYMVIVGQKEQDAGNISVRRREEGDLGALGVDEFVKMLNESLDK